MKTTKYQILSCIEPLDTLLHVQLAYRRVSYVLFILIYFTQKIEENKVKTLLKIKNMLNSNKIENGFLLKGQMFYAV